MLRVHPFLHPSHAAFALQHSVAVKSTSGRIVVRCTVWANRCRFQECRGWRGVQPPVFVLRFIHRRRHLGRPPRRQTRKYGSNDLVVDRETHDGEDRRNRGEVELETSEGWRMTLRPASRLCKIRRGRRALANNRLRPSPFWLRLWLIPACDTIRWAKRGGGAAIWSFALCAPAIARAGHWWQQGTRFVCSTSIDWDHSRWSWWAKFPRRPFAAELPPAVTVEVGACTPW